MSRTPGIPSIRRPQTLPLAHQGSREPFSPSETGYKREGALRGGAVQNPTGGGPRLEFFDSAYEGTPPWDIGRPQSEFVRLEQAGRIGTSVVDIGCGTGENTLYMAEQGHEAWGVDASTRAIAKAKAKSASRGIPVTFRVGDALRLDRLGRTFETAIDSGLFHTFSDPERVQFLQSLASVLVRNGSYFMLAFCDREPADWGGPRRLTQAEIRATFFDGWSVESIQSARFESNIHPDGGLAWLSTVTRLP